jgi:Arc/MetJ-type ribon-helix-helix transcriptional regulator
MMELVTFKMESRFLDEVDQALKSFGFHSRTEFIRESIREKIEELKLKKAMIELAHLKGLSKKKTGEAELESIRLKVFEELKTKIK